MMASENASRVQPMLKGISGKGDDEVDLIECSALDSTKDIVQNEAYYAEEGN